MNVNSTSSTNTSAASSKGLSGLMSGMDTDAMVEALLTGTQNKIDSQNALLKQTTWKQEIYRDLITDINAFKSKYFDILGTSSFLDSATFTAVTSSSSSSAVSATASAYANLGNYKIDVAQLATATSITSSAKASGKLYADFGTLDSAATLKITFDGVEKSITLDPADLRGSLQEGLDKAFGRGAITLTQTADGRYAFETSSDGHSITVSGDKAALNAIGFDKSRSNTINLNTELKNISFAGGLMGSKFEFTINGVDFSFSESDTLSSVMSKINSSDAGVTVSYDSLTDTFKMERTQTGRGCDITMSQKSGNLLSAMFGVNNADSYTGTTLVTNTINGTGSVSDTDTFEEGVFKIVVNGKEYSFSIPRKTTSPAEYTGKEITDELNKQLLSSFGKNSDGEAAIKISQDGKLEINSKLSVSFNAEDTGSLNKVFGLTSGDNKVTAQSTVSDIIGINKNYLSSSQLSGDLGSLLSGSGATLNENGEIVATDTFTDETLQKAVFGTTLTFGDGTDSGNGYTLTEGQNAVFAVNGVVTERSSNNFENNGITFTFNSVTDSSLSAEYDENGKLTGISGLDSTAGSATVSSSKNLDKVMETIKSFVNDYNTLIGKLNDKIGEERTYKKYAPLTDAQKKEMSDREIELWEEKAKTGLLANDSTISSFLSDMRSILYTKSDSAGIALYDIGIDTGAYTDKGKLVIDEAALRSALETNGDAVTKLFSGSDGLGKKMATVIDSVAKVSSGSPGTLVSLAGTKSTLSDTNTLTERISSINDKITQLKAQYESEKNRYWTQFNTMEKLLSDLNSQSSWLTSMFSGS